MSDPFHLLTAVLSIVVIDLVLSGDNAVVIGLAARRLSPENRRRAIVLGGLGAVGLRIAFTAAAALLLGIPYLQAAGGLLLLWIAYKLVRPQQGEAKVSEAGSLGEAVRTIILADVVMSLDNILAVGGAAHGHIWLLLFGLALSIPILMLGSELVARLLGRFPVLVYVGVLVLIFTAVGMILEDKLIADLHETTRIETAVATLVVAAVIILVGRRGRNGSEKAQDGDSDSPSPTSVSGSPAASHLPHEG